MPDIRPNSAPVRPPRQRNQGLDPFTRTKLVELKNVAGWTYKQIHAEYPSVPISTIKATVQRANERVDNQSLPRSGRPRKLDDDDRKLLLEAIKENPRITYEDLLATVSHKVKKDSIRRHLQAEDLRKSRCLARPNLKDEHAAKRLRSSLRGMRVRSPELQNPS